MLILRKFVHIFSNHNTLLNCTTWPSNAATKQNKWWGCLLVAIYPSLYKAHRENCPKALTPCPYGCGATILNEDRVSHAESCPQKPVVCRLCQEAIAVDESSSGCPPLVSPPPSHFNMNMHNLWRKMSTQITACKVLSSDYCHFVM